MLGKIIPLSKITDRRGNIGSPYGLLAVSS